MAIDPVFLKIKLGIVKLRLLLAEAEASGELDVELEEVKAGAPWKPGDPDPDWVKRGPNGRFGGGGASSTAQPAASPTDTSRLQVDQLPTPAINGLAGKSREAFSKVLQGTHLKDVGNEIRSGFRSLGKKVTEAYDAVTAKVSEAGKAIKDGFEAVQAKLNEVTNSVKQFAADHALETIGAAMLIGAGVATVSGVTEVAASGMGALRLGTFLHGLSGTTIAQRALVLGAHGFDSPAGKVIYGLSKLRVAEKLTIVGLMVGGVGAAIRSTLAEDKPAKPTSEKKPSERNGLFTTETRISVSNASVNGVLVEEPEAKPSEESKQIGNSLVAKARDMVASVKKDLKGIQGSAIAEGMGVDPEIIRQKQAAADSGPIEVALAKLKSLFGQFLKSYSSTPDKKKDAETSGILAQIGNLISEIGS